KAELEAQLKALDRDIRAVDGGQAPPTTNGAKRSTVQPPASAAPGLPLSERLLALVRRAPGPVTVKQLSEALLKQPFETRSRNIPMLVKTAVQKLLVKGLLRRAEGQPGVLPAKAAGTPARPAVLSTAPAAA